MARFIDLHDTNIAQKVEIIIEHFRANVAGCLGGKAKAMVITSSREAAVKYRQEFEQYIEARGYTGIKALVAFSGKVKLDGKEYTEAGMNGFKEKDLRYEFNRICPPYDKTTFVLDFKNSYDDIKAAFEPYYKDTILFETISPSDIRDLDREIDSYDFLDADDIDEFNTYLYKDNCIARDKQRMWSLLDGALKKITKRSELKQMEIKITIRRFLKGYCFLIQATAYENLV